MASQDAQQPNWQAAIDIGGTFTDVLAVDRASGQISIDKLLTTHGDPASGVSDGLSRVLQQTHAPGFGPGPLVHATTLVTNAVIERKGVPTALLITEGFRDTLSIGREHRYDMYDVLLAKPEPLVHRRDTFEVPERILADGTIHRALDGAAVISIADELQKRDIRSVAVCFLHSYRNPEHELRTRECLLERWPELQVTLSHEVIGELREYERASTTVTNAYVLALVNRYLQQLERNLQAIGHPGQILVMLSNGALATTDTARTFPVRLIESGPAAGAIAAAQAGHRMSLRNLMSFDMGGTTAKACIIEDGRPSIANEFEVARLKRFARGSGIPLQISSVELIEIGAGGGSIARVDPFGLIQVGPDSAGSEPGPICYGRGGHLPTVTDADLVLGYLDPNFFLGGRMKLELALTEGEIAAQIANPLGMSVAAAAWAIHEIVNENMANAARVHAVERGVNVQQFPVFAFGGAGPVHAYRVAKNLGVTAVITPLGAGIGSTIGLLAAPLAFDFVRTAVFPIDSIDWATVAPLVESMELEGTEVLGRAGVDGEMVTIERSIDMRLAGQAHEITVEMPGDRPKPGDEASMSRTFERTYARLFGRPPPHVPVEVVNWRVRVEGPRPRFPIDSGMTQNRDDARMALKGFRQAYFPEVPGYTKTPVYDRYALSTGVSITGPLLIEERESTTVVGPGAEVRVDEYLNVIVELPG